MPTRSRCSSSSASRASDAARLNRIARGHPLALMLASAGVSEHPELALEDAALTRVVEELTRLYLEDVEDPLARRALEAASVVRRVTEPLLAAMLEETDGGEALRRLLDAAVRRRRPRRPRRARGGARRVAGFLRGTNPTRYRGYRRAAWRELRAEIARRGPGELWRYTADMLYLIDNPVVARGVLPERHAAARRRARAAPTTPPRSPPIARRHEGREAAALLERWWADGAGDVLRRPRPRRHRRGLLRAARGRACSTGRSSRGDPVLEAWARDLREHPLPKGQLALGLRRWLDAERGELPCASQAACWLDVKRTYMALRPALRRMYVVVHDVPTYWPVVERLGFRPFAGRRGRARRRRVRERGPRLRARARSTAGSPRSSPPSSASATTPSSTRSARELAVQGERVALTPLEFGLFRHLREREGQIVTRGELLREVWGTEFTGGSNVVDAVVRSLRRKLGARRGRGDRARQRLPPARRLARAPELDLIEVSSARHRTGPPRA